MEVKLVSPHHMMICTGFGVEQVTVDLVVDAQLLAELVTRAARADEKEALHYLGMKAVVTSYDREWEKVVPSCPNIHWERS